MSDPILKQSPHLHENHETGEFKCDLHPETPIYYMTDQEGDLIPFCRLCTVVHDMEKESAEPVVKDSLTTDNEGKENPDV